MTEVNKKQKEAGDSKTAEVVVRENKVDNKASGAKDSKKPASLSAQPGSSSPILSRGHSDAGQAGKSKIKKARRGDKLMNNQKDDFEQRILDLARVTRVMAGGKRMRFRACVAIGDKKGRIGIGMGKGADVTSAVTKGVNKAKKNIINVPIVNDTIPHEVYHKFSAAKILFKPARKGRGVIAGGVVRIILELAGVKSVTSKILGTNNKVSNAKCTIEALSKLKKVEGKKYKV